MPWDAASRKLDLPQLAHDFLLRTLGSPDDQNTRDLAMRIAEAESVLGAFRNRSTLVDTQMRMQPYVDDQRRITLRRQIVQELIRLKRKKDPDKTRLGSGGLLPRGKPIRRLEREAFIVIGAPGSGKSTLAEALCDRVHAAIIDTDITRRKIPEFGGGGSAIASHLVHDEAVELTWAATAEQVGVESAVNRLLAKNWAIVAPRIGAEAKSVRIYRDELESRGYRCHLVLVHAPRETCVRRVIERFRRTGRYVPLATVYDVFGNGSDLAYHQVRDDKSWLSAIKVDGSGHRDRRSIEDQRGPAAPDILPLLLS